MCSLYDKQNINYILHRLKSALLHAYYNIANHYQKQKGHLNIT